MKKRLLQMIEVAGGDATHIKVELYYSLGGYSYFTYKNEPRGLYLSIQPVKVGSGEGYKTESYSAFSGNKKLVKEMTKFSQKTLNSFVVDETELNGLINFVAERNKIQINEILV